MCACGALWVRRLPWVRTCWPVLVLSVVQNVGRERQHAERQPAGVVFGAELPEDVDSVVEPAVWDSAADDWVRGWVGLGVGDACCVDGAGS